MQDRASRGLPPPGHLRRRCAWEEGRLGLLAWLGRAGDRWLRPRVPRPLGSPGGGRRRRCCCCGLPAESVAEGARRLAGVVRDKRRRGAGHTRTWRRALEQCAGRPVTARRTNDAVRRGLEALQPEQHPRWKTDVYTRVPLPMRARRLSATPTARTARSGQQSMPATPGQTAAGAPRRAPGGRRGGCRWREGCKAACPS